MQKGNPTESLIFALANIWIERGKFPGGSQRKSCVWAQPTLKTKQKSQYK